MPVDMKAKNRGSKPQSLPGTPAGKKNFKPQNKKSFSPNNKPGGGPKGSPGGKPFFKNNNEGGRPSFNKNEGKSPFKGGQGRKSGGGPPPQKQENKQSPKPKFEQNGNAKKNDVLKQLDKKSKPNFKGNKVSANKQEKNASRKNKNVNRYHRFQQKLNSKVRTPQACARALKAEQELSSTQGRVLKITLPDPVYTTDQVNKWSDGIESILFAKPIAPRQFTIVLKTGVNVKKEIEKFSKMSLPVGSGKVTVKEQDSADLGHTGGQEVSDPSTLIDPYTLYVTNLPETVNKVELEKYFEGCVASNPRKHNPKYGNPSKFSFITYETPEAALASLNENFNKTIEGKSIVMRFRRLNHTDLRALEKKEKEQKQVKTKQEANSPAKAPLAKAAKALQQVKKGDAKKQLQSQKGVKAVKKEPMEEDEDDDDESDEEMEMDDDDSDESGEGAGGLEMDEDDDDDDSGEDEVDDDEDDDDDDDDEDDD